MLRGPAIIIRQTSSFRSDTDLPEVPAALLALGVQVQRHRWLHTDRRTPSPRSMGDVDHAHQLLLSRWGLEAL